MPQVTLTQNILAPNETIATEIQQTLATLHIRTLNIMGSPGAGKTALLERSITHLRDKLHLGVIEGDIETSADAERIETAGAQAVQINTQGACHLEAHMVLDALTKLTLPQIELLVIENIGNLVCPTAWKLGEDQRVVVMSVTEGDDKPTKYPQIFMASHVLVLNKLDLLPYVDYDLEKVRRDVLAINPHLRLFELSCRTGEGLDTWCEWLVAFARGEK